MSSKGKDKSAKAARKEAERKAKEAKLAAEKAAKANKEAEKPASKKQAEKPADKPADKPKETDKPVEKPKAETKKEEKKQEPPKPAQKEKKAETKPAEKPAEKKETAVVIPTDNNVSDVTGMLNKFAGSSESRLSPDATVQLIGLMKSMYLDSDKTEEKKKLFMAKTADAMIAMSVLQWATQIRLDAGTAFGVKFSSEREVNLLAEALDWFGVKTNITNQNGQMLLDFQVDEKAAKLIKNNAPVRKEMEIPAASPDYTEEDKVKNIRLTLSKSGTATAEDKAKGLNAMLINIRNGVEYTRLSYGMENNTIAEVVAKMVSLYDHKGPQDAMILSGVSKMMYGMLNANPEPFVLISLLMNLWPTASLTDIANVVNIFVSRHIDRIITGEEKFEDYDIVNLLNADFDDTVVNALVEGTEEDFPRDIKVGKKDFLSRIHPQKSNITLQMALSSFCGGKDSGDFTKNLKTKLHEIQAAYNPLKVYKYAAYLDGSAFK